MSDLQDPYAPTLEELAVLKQASSELPRPGIYTNGFQLRTCDITCRHGEVLKGEVVWQRGPYTVRCRTNENGEWICH